MNNRLITILLLLLFSVTGVQAHEAAAGTGKEDAAKEFLTVDRLLASGYRQLNGRQLMALMSTKTIVVRDIATDRVSISENENGGGMDRTFSEPGDVADSRTLYFLDTRLLARAPALQGKITRRVVDNELVASDGTRTYHYRVFEKDGRMFAARDIDNGSVYYEVTVK